MHTRVHKSSENKNEPAHAGKSADEGSAFAFSDNRPGTQALKDVLATRYTPPEVKASGDPAANQHEPPLKTDRTGLPAKLMAGIENLSGISMSAVQVHYNSTKPAQLQAHAYTQGTEIHVGRGQEKHLPHEAWHVVQQQQRRVKPTLQTKSGAFINDDSMLEEEADVMGARAAQWKGNPSENIVQKKGEMSGNSGVTVLQCCFSDKLPDADTFRQWMRMNPEVLERPKGSLVTKGAPKPSATKQEYKQESSDVKDQPELKPEDPSAVKVVKPLETTASSGVTVTTAKNVESEAAPPASPEQFLSSICQRLPRYHDVRGKIKLSNDKKETQQTDKKEHKEDNLQQDLVTLMQLNDELEHDAYGYMVSNAAALYIDKEPLNTPKEGTASESKAQAPAIGESEAASNNRRVMQTFLNALQQDHSHIVEKLLKLANEIPQNEPLKFKGRSIKEQYGEIVATNNPKAGTGTLYVAPDSDAGHKRKAEHLWHILSKNFNEYIGISQDSDLKLKDGDFSSFKKDVYAMFAKLLTRPAGLKVVEQLIDSGRKIYIELGKTASTSHTTADSRGISTGGSITMTLRNLKADYNNTARGKEGRLPFPAFLTLAHELVHLLHLWTGLVDYAQYKDLELRKQYTNAEERSTIDHENLIRKEHGLGERTHHAFSKEDEASFDCCTDLCIIQ
ncbi:DUF4157 domain-containing protein [Fulvivirgaceae bacterium PWU4]|uniref:DUF4157 domain-containing protein n=1 Tax=Chryseosolibacter histidini TaxID=2782349 RepID=A0AAP2DGN4_9BACT|nr:M91 family zinc metallopeptidase [Chryseosolibacter histidini]MBT1695960.1 DUF4157 domain-containing protein [Chryseosolibacter histidini]